ncbi:hypothetical protein PITC_094450 [Penicillium italicum]|uniref:Uncharacterized protein n=1 Tax=Penicillium italicum TaxID=40296 RepID=A0A0A2KL11_PENIT|nr:hypothetical protein PITC_094450 [Penicillium italicum]
MTCQAQHVEMDHVHFVFIYIDTQGRLHLHCSRSIAKTCRGALEAKLTDAFVEAVRISGESCSPINHGKFHIGRRGVRFFKNASIIHSHYSETAPTTDSPHYPS